MSGHPVSTGVWTPHDLFAKRLELAAEMLTLALREAATVPASQVDALREALRHLGRVQAWCATHSRHAR
jgi:hypothetical protein